MRFSCSLAAASLLALCACDTPGGTTAEPAGATANGAAPPAPSPAAQARSGAGWNLQATGDGAGLVLLSPSGLPAIRLFCPAGRSELLVNVPSFRPIGSEERLSFGGGGEAAALVADSKGDSQRGGVSAVGAVPRNLAAMISGQLSASYGAQTSGPHQPPPPNLAQRFAAACYRRLSVPPAPPPGEPPSAAGACMTQDGRQLRVAPLRAVGTEPFWAARIEGRCVTYSHPDDQRGTRVWTRYRAGPGGGTWSGALNGRPFELRARPAPGCSDGMSDRRYPIAVDLLVGGERRRGCAAAP